MYIILPIISLIALELSFKLDALGIQAMGLFNDLIKLHIKDPLKEAELKKGINSFDDISDNVSKKVLRII